jgi:hypothetical protein
MTGFTCDRTPLFTGPLLLFVAFCAQLFHNLFFLQLAFGFKLLDNARLLGKNGMADFTVDKHFLVAMVGKMVGKSNFPAFAASQGYIFCSFVLDRLGPGNNHHQADKQSGNRFGLYF